jgi:hypothetical protein
MSKELDEKALALLKDVEAKRLEISKLTNKVNYETRLTFALPDGKQINLNTVFDVNKLIYYFSIIKSQIDSIESSAKLLGVEEFDNKFEGFTLDEWASDFKTKIGLINIKQLKEDLKFKEDKLNGIISEDKKKELEFEKILKDFSK